MEGENVSGRHAASSARDGSPVAVPEGALDGSVGVGESDSSDSHGDVVSTPGGKVQFGVGSFAASRKAELTFELVGPRISIDVEGDIGQTSSVAVDVVVVSTSDED